MNKIIIMLTLGLSGCSSLFGNSGPEIDRIKVETIYATIPDDYLVCPLPPVIPDEVLTAILQSETAEDDYNRTMVAEYFNNNETCARNMGRIRRLNQRWQEHNAPILREGNPQ